jgi:hypothetical protein
MGRKLTLSMDALEVSSFETGAPDSLEGTVKGHDANASVPYTVVLTTPCCGSQVTCPSAPGIICPVAGVP